MMRPMFGALRPRDRRRRRSRSSRSARSTTGTSRALGLTQAAVAVRGCRGLGKRDMKLNDALPQIDGRSRDLRGRAPTASCSRCEPAPRAAAGAALLPVLRSPCARWLVLQLADSAFPTGGFAHSLGPRGGVAARRGRGARRSAALRRGDDPGRPATARCRCVNAAHREPARLAELDALADAFLTNHVANRASRAQGRALLATARARSGRRRLARAARRGARGDAVRHLAPVFGAVFARARRPLRRRAARRACSCAARGVLSAAVRLGVVGSYEAQRLQSRVRAVLDAVARRAARRSALDDLAQTAPLLDLLQAAHDRLYSRLFQS